MPESLSKRTAKSSLWSIADVLFRQGMGFVISIVLARLLTPAEFGTVGVMMVFIVIANVFVDSGFSSGLIRKLDRTQDDLSTAFFFNIIVAVAVYAVLFAAAPAIASFFNAPGVKAYLRVLGLMLLFNSLNMVQNAMLIASMKIRQVTMVSAAAQITTGVVAIALAYRGWGVWALVWQQVLAAAVQAVLLAFATRWRPRLVFSRQSFSYLWNYGSKLLTANLIGTLFGQAYPFVIGKALGKHNLGLYTQADKFAVQPSYVVTNIVNKSLVPSLAECQNNLERLRLNYRRCVELISLGIFPLMFTLGLAAEPLFKVFFGSKWDDAIPLFQILCFGYAIDVFSTISLTLMQVMGRTDYTLKLEFIKKPFYALIIVVTVFLGLKWIVIGKAVYCLIAALINLSVVKTLLKYSYWRQVMDIFKYAVAAIVVLAPACALVWWITPVNWLRLVLFPIIGLGLYAAVSLRCKFRAVDFLIELKNRRKAAK